jgi:fructokinase
LQADFREIVAGYLASKALDAEGISEFIVPPVLGDDAGVCGAIALAHEALATRP